MDKMERHKTRKRILKKTRRRDKKTTRNTVKLNDACQRTHPLAIDLFLIMLVTLNIALAWTSPQYEIITEHLAFYEAQTNNTLITQTQAQEINQERKAFKNKLTIFGTIIFILYALTQWTRWKQKINTWKKTK